MKYKYRKIVEYILFKLSKKMFLRHVGLKYGKNCRFINIQRSTFGSEPYLIVLGNHVTITSDVKFVTHDGGVWVVREEYPELDVFAPISIGNNVFIGLSTIILPGTEVSDNVVIGAGSVVSGKLESNSVYAGIPAKKIRNLDEYKVGLMKRGINTKNLSPSEKKSIISSLIK